MREAGQQKSGAAHWRTISSLRFRLCCVAPLSGMLVVPLALVDVAAAHASPTTTSPDTQPQFVARRVTVDLGTLQPGQTVTQTIPLSNKDAVQRALADPRTSATERGGTGSHPSGCHRHRNDRCRACHASFQSKPSHYLEYRVLHYGRCLRDDLPSRH